VPGAICGNSDKSTRLLAGGVLGTNAMPLFDVPARLFIVQSHVASRVLSSHAIRRVSPRNATENRTALLGGMVKAGTVLCHLSVFSLFAKGPDPTTSFLISARIKSLKSIPSAHY